MRLKLFFQTFPDEKSCKMYVKNFRESQGVCCKRCSKMNHFWMKKKEQWQCKNCKFRTTLKSGTIMESTKLSFQSWFYTMALMTMTKKGFSAKEIQRQLGRKRYEPVWYMMHKIRRRMGEKMSNHDDLFAVFEQDVITIMDQETLTRQEKVISIYAMNKDRVRHQYRTEVMHLKVIELEDLEKVLIRREKFGLNQKSIGKNWQKKPLQNLMRILDGIHHQVSGKYLQNYLDEFSYKYIQRDNEQFIFDSFILGCFNVFVANMRTFDA